MAGSQIVSGARTPIGKLSGALAACSAMELGGIAIKAALARAGVAPEEVDYVVMGHVLGAGQGQITARQAAVNAGIPMVTPATTVNKVCLSGLNAIHLADLMIRAGEAAVVVAGGMESMTRAPYLLPGARAGYRLGDQRVVDSMMYDGLFCAFDRVAMGMSADAYSRVAGITRERQDAIAALSQARAAAAVKEGRFAEEIVPVLVPQRKGDPIVVDTDEGVRPETTVESLARLRAAFDEEGTVTAGNSSQISDGAAAVLVMSPDRVDELGLTPLGEIVGYGQVAGPDASLLTQPSHAILEAVGAGRPRAGRRRPVRDQRGLRGGDRRLDGRPRGHRRDRQRERWRHRPRPPHRHVRDEAGPGHVLRAAPAGRRRRRRRAVRRGRPGGRRYRARARLTGRASSAGTAPIEMCPGQELDAGWFAAWLEAMNAALEGARDSEVPCGECTACCTSSQFVHIDPDETGTLARIPEELLFPALRLPREHFVMGYDAHVAVPDAGGRPVLHLPAPAPECRTYDCRIFAASGLAPDGAAPGLHRGPGRPVEVPLRGRRRALQIRGRPVGAPPPRGEPEDARR